MKVTTVPVRQDEYLVPQAGDVIETPPLCAMRKGNWHSKVVYLRAPQSGTIPAGSVKIAFNLQHKRRWRNELSDDEEATIMKFLLIG